MNSTIERLLSLRVADVMRREVITLSPDDTMAAAAARMLELGVWAHRLSTRRKS